MEYYQWLIKKVREIYQPTFNALFCRIKDLESVVDSTDEKIVLGTNSISFGSSAPSDGDWSQGDIVFNTGASAGGFAGWICVTSGTPGTWKTFGVISA